jgi:hypothetical protein
MGWKVILQKMEEHIDPEWKEEVIEAVGRKSNQQGAGWVDPMAMMQMERDASMKRIEANFEKLLDREAVPAAERNEFLKKIDLLTDDLTQMIARVVAHPSTDRNKKMIKIVELDSRFLGFTSARWGELRDCSDGCIRKQPFWKMIKQMQKGPH